MKKIPEKHQIILNKFPHSEQFIAFMNHANCVTRYAKYTTIESAYNSDMIKLSDLRNIYSVMSPFYFIESWLLQLNIFVNTENKLSGQQIQELSSYMYDEVYMLNMAELTILFKRIKNGHYGVFYNRIDATQIVTWCRSFRAERSRIITPIIDEQNKAKDLIVLEKKVKAEKRIRRQKLNFKRKAKLFWNHTKNK